MPLPRRRLTSLLTRYNGSSLLIDCGEGTQVAVKERGWTFKPIDTICFTHYHADHISGLPGLLLTMGNADRREPLTMIGPKGLERVVNALRVICPELPFPIRFLEITEPEMKVELNGYQITAFRVQHNVICYGYTIEIPRKGKFDVERAKAQQIPVRYWNPLQKGETVDTKALAACFQKTVCEVLVGHLELAAQRLGYRSIAAAGGVSANSGLREGLAQMCRKNKFDLHIPPLSLCGDNAAMIGAQAYYEQLVFPGAGWDLNAAASMSIEAAF